MYTVQCTLYNKEHIIILCAKGVQFTPYIVRTRIFILLPRPNIELNINTDINKNTYTLDNNYILLVCVLYHSLGVKAVSSSGAGDGFGVI